MMAPRKMTSRKTLLTKLLVALIDEWGIEEVRRAFDELDGSPSPVQEVAKASTKTGRRSNAVDQIRRADISDDARSILLLLAERYDRKIFLPSTADVRQFLIMAGQHTGSLKDRSESFRALLSYLKTLSPDNLQVIASASSLSGPTQLGRISDAISSASGRRSSVSPYLKRR